MRHHEKKAKEAPATDKRSRFFPEGDSEVIPVGTPAVVIAYPSTPGVYSDKLLYSQPGSTRCRCPDSMASSFSKLEFPLIRHPPVL